MEKTVQDLMFEIMELSGFNSFDGVAVVKSLKEHKDLWKGVIMDREYCHFYSKGIPDKYVSGISLIKLRDIKNNIYNVDTLFILPSGKDDKTLFSLAKTWGADEVDWVENDEHYDLGMGGPGSKIKMLRIWWD